MTGPAVLCHWQCCVVPSVTVHTASHDRFCCVVPSVTVHASSHDRLCCVVPTVTVLMLSHDRLCCVVPTVTVHTASCDRFCCGVLAVKVQHQVFWVLCPELKKPLNDAPTLTPTTSIEEKCPEGGPQAPDEGVSSSSVVHSNSTSAFNLTAPPGQSIASGKFIRMTLRG